MKMRMTEPTVHRVARVSWVPGGKIGREVQEPRHNIAIEKPTRERQRWLGQNEEKAGDKEVRQALQVIQLDSPDPVDALVRLELLRIGLGIKGCLLEVLRRAEATPRLHHTNDGQPR